MRHIFNGSVSYLYVMIFPCILVIRRQHSVAYLRHVRTVTLKHVPAITQRRRSGVFSVPSRAKLSSAVLWLVACRLATPRLICCQATAINRRDHVTVSAVTSRILTVTQQLKHRWKDRFPLLRSRVYKRDWSSFTNSSWWEIAVVLAADSRRRFVVGEDLIVWIEDFMWAVFSWVIVFSSDPEEWIEVEWSEWVTEWVKSE
jgi:hypothetical protein